MKNLNKGLKILTVFSDGAQTAELDKICSEENHETQKTSDVEQAVALSEMIYFDAAFVDHGLAVKNEAELIWRLSETLPSMKIILVMPGKPEKDDLNKLAKKKVFCKIKGPINEKSIAEVIRKIPKF